MGICIGKQDQEDDIYSTRENRPPRKKAKFVKRSSKACSRLHKLINDTYHDGELVEMEYIMTYGLFLGMLNRYENTLDPVFAVQMKALEATLTKILDDRMNSNPEGSPYHLDKSIEQYDDLFATPPRPNGKRSYAASN